MNERFQTNPLLRFRYLSRSNWPNVLRRPLNAIVMVGVVALCYFIISVYGDGLASGLVAQLPLATLLVGVYGFIVAIHQRGSAIAKHAKSWLAALPVSKRQQTDSAMVSVAYSAAIQVGCLLAFGLLLASIVDSVDTLTLLVVVVRLIATLLLGCTLGWFLSGTGVLRWFANPGQRSRARRARQVRGHGWRALAGVPLSRLRARSSSRFGSLVWLPVLLALPGGSGVAVIATVLLLWGAATTAFALTSVVSRTIPEVAALLWATPLSHFVLVKESCSRALAVWFLCGVAFLLAFTLLHYPWRDAMIVLGVGYGLIVLRLLAVARTALLPQGIRQRRFVDVR